MISAHPRAAVGPGLFPRRHWDVGRDRNGVVTSCCWGTGLHFCRCVCRQLPWLLVGSLPPRHIRPTKEEVSVSLLQRSSRHRRSLVNKLTDAFRACCRTLTAGLAAGLHNQSCRFSVTRVPAASGHCLSLFFHSEDLEDTEFCLGHPRRRHLHDQHLHEGAGAPARAARIRAVSTPAHPHQGEPRTDRTVRDGSFSWSLSAPSACRNSLGVMETTLCSTTPTPTRFPTATRAPITEGIRRFPASPLGGI